MRGFWKQNGKQLTVNQNEYTLLTMTVDGDTMYGEGKYLKGPTVGWTFSPSMTRVRDGVGSEQAATASVLSSTENVVTAAPVKGLPSAKEHGASLGTTSDNVPKRRGDQVAILSRGGDGEGDEDRVYCRRPLSMEWDAESRLLEARRCTDHDQRERFHIVQADHQGRFHDRDVGAAAGDRFR